MAQIPIYDPSMFVWVDEISKIAEGNMDIQSEVLLPKITGFSFVAKGTQQ